MYCTSCGAKSRDDAKFCGSCGKQIRSSESATEDTPLASTSQATVTQGNEKDKDKLLVVVAHIGSCFFSFLAPLVVYVMRKDGDERARWARDNAVSALNFQLTVLLLIVVILVLQAVIAYRVSNWTLPMFLDGTGESLARWSDILNIVLVSAILLDYLFCIVGAVKSTGGRVYKYPTSISFIRHDGVRVIPGDEPTAFSGATRSVVHVAQEGQDSKSVHEQATGSFEAQPNKISLRIPPKKYHLYLVIIAVVGLGVLAYVSSTKDKYREPALTEAIMNSPETEFQRRVHTNSSKLDVYRNIDEMFAWVKDGSHLLFKVHPSDGLSEPELVKEEGGTQYWVFSSHAGNACEGPHIIVITTAGSVKTHEIKTCAQWGYVRNYLTISGDNIKYSPPK